MMKNYQSKLLRTGLILLLSLNYTFPLKAETVLEEIQRTGVLKVGVRSDAVPFGYRDNNNRLRGICLDFIALVREQLRKTIDRDIITVQLFISTLYNRFEIVEDNIVYFECGPNTIREVEEYDIVFTKPFFVTGTQFLVKKDLAKSINRENNLADLKIGVLRYTTAEKFIKNKFPDAEIELFQGVRGTLRATQAVQQGRIDAFADDGILLVGEAILLGLSLNEDYQIIPETPMTCETYGLIMPKNDPTWLDFINSVIDSGEDRKILKEWFSVLASELKKNEQACQEELEILPQ